MASILKVDTIQDQSGNNIINENADTITIGASGDTITIPSGATIDLSNATQTGVGKILQVVNGTTNVFANSTTNALVDTGLTATITPTSASNKILVLAQQNGLAKVGNNFMELILLRGATQIATFGNALAYTATAADNRIGGAGLCYLDNPITTSATTYKTQFKSASNGADVTVQDNSALSTIILMEIQA